MDTSAQGNRAFPTSKRAAQAPGGADRWMRLRSLSRQTLPDPGSGKTLLRWRVFAEVAEDDLALAKVYESHADAVAILSELNVDVAPGIWAVFAAEPPTMVLNAAGDPPRLSGEKAWCSAAAHVERALVTCLDESGGRRLVQVALDEPGITLEPSSWAPAGMADAETVDLVFSDVPCSYVGGARAYLDRAGFWHGAIGVAACWYGAAAGLAREFRTRCVKRADAHALVHLGAIDASLRASRDVLREAARIIDGHPAHDAKHLALACRATIERTVEDVLGRCGHALGAGPLCRDPTYAKRVQDLMVFVRQSHAERDLAILGECCAADDDEWSP